MQQCFPSCNRGKDQEHEGLDADVSRWGTYFLLASISSMDFEWAHPPRPCVEMLCASQLRKGESKLGRKTVQVWWAVLTNSLSLCSRIYNAALQPSCVISSPPWSILLLRSEPGCSDIGWLPCGRELRSMGVEVLLGKGTQEGEVGALKIFAREGWCVIVMVQPGREASGGRARSRKGEDRRCVWNGLNV